MGSLVILSGPVGSGKTTVARELVASAPGPLIYIEGDSFWSYIVKADESQPPPKRFAMVMRAMLAAARHFLRDGYDVLVDFSIPPWFLEATRALLTGGEFQYVVLRPREDVCRQRAAARPVGAIADYTPYRHLYMSFDGVERYTIDDDESEPAQIAARIRAGIDAGTFLYVAGEPQQTPA